MQILKLFKMKNCSFKSKTGQIKCFVKIDLEKRIFVKYYLHKIKKDNTEIDNCKSEH
jgi:hypothetical protein